ncbi:hypothetical protein KCU71_g6667, partial [Aureobasidium melanogenum]
MEVIWIICWGAWGLAYLLPYGIQFFAGFITTHSRKYAELLQAIILPMALFFWALLSRAATPVLCAFDENRPGECDDEWIAVLRKILLATVASTGIFFVEKILIHILTINYRQKQFRVRLQDIERTVYILTLMYQASRDRFPIHCPEFATEDHKIHDSRLVDVAERKTSRQFSTSTTGSRLSVMANNMKKRLAGREVLKHDSARSVVLHALETTTASEALAIRLYRSFTAAGSQGEILESDVAQVLGPTRSQEAQDIFHALDKDENGDVSLEEMTSLITQTSNDKHSMRRGLYDIGQAIQSLDNLLCLTVLLAAGLIYAAFFSQAIASKVTALWGGIAATSFAISGTVQEFLGSCIFLFVKHPYDVGDHVVINNTNMAVEQISLMYSVFRQIDSGSIVQISNMVNNAAWIRNISRSKPMKESYDFAISAKTKFPAIENLKTELQAFVLAPENRRDFQPAIDVELISVGNLKELKLRVKICQKSNFANDSLYSRRRTKFMCALLSALRKHDIKSPGGGGPPPVGSWENPGYSVAVTDIEAQEARAKYEAEEEAKRLRKLNEHALKLNTKRNPDKKPDQFAAAASVVTHLGKWRKAGTQPKDDVFSSAYNSVTAQEQSYDSAAQSTAIEQHSDYPEDYGANTKEDDGAYDGTTIAGATLTQTAVYATATVSPPSNVARGTTPFCSKYYTVQSGDDCGLIALNKTISIGLFESINPSVNSDCTNLTPGLAYCVFSTANWNLQTWNEDLNAACRNLILSDAYYVQGDTSGNGAAAVSSTMPVTMTSPGGPTQSGITAGCKQYYTVKSGDSCAGVKSTFGISFAQLMSYTPPGWTAQHVANATADELLRLDYSTLHLIAPNAVSSPAAQDVLLGALIDERSRLEQLRLKLPPQDPIFAPTTIPPSDPVHRDVLEQRKHRWLLKERERYFSDPGAPIVPTPSMPKHKPDVDAVVQVVEEAGYDDFGFAIVRLDYTDEEEWERWKGIFDTVQDQSVDECLGGAKIKDKLLTMFVEDEELQGTGWHGAVSYFSDLRANDQVPEGLDTPIILVADEFSITSLLHPTSNVKPWIWAVDLSHDWVIGDVPPVAVTPTDIYPGYFRVALEAVIPELWPLLKGTGISGLELWGGDDSVWEGP